MPLTPTELLIPRVLAIGTEPGTPNYPGSLWRTGDILTIADIDEQVIIHKDGESYMPHVLFLKIGDAKSYIKSFPNCFRSLEWWEHRTPEQMPLYLKHGENGKVRKVKEYSTGERLTIAVFEGCLIRRLNKEWIPCDEAEYLEYQKQKQ